MAHDTNIYGDVDNKTDLRTMFGTMCENDEKWGGS